MGYSHDGIPLNVLFLHLKLKDNFSWEAEVRFRVQPPAKFPLRPDGGWDSARPEECEEWYPLTFATLDWIDEVVTAPSLQVWAAIGELANEKGLTFRRSSFESSMVVGARRGRV